MFQICRCGQKQTCFLLLRDHLEHNNTNDFMAVFNLFEDYLHIQIQIRCPDIVSIHREESYDATRDNIISLAVMMQ